MIDTSTWKGFKVGDLFEIHPTCAYKMSNAQLMDGGNIPVVVNSAYNNGVGGYSSQMPTECGNMVTFSDTVDANTIFYQPCDFIGYPHVQGLYPRKDQSRWNEYTYLFFVSVFKNAALAKGFDYGNKFRRDIAATLTVNLPAFAPPDWQKLHNLLAGGVDMSKIDTSNWREYKVGDYFTVIRGTSRKMQALDDGNVALIAAARNNRGIAGYYDVPAEYENAITISCNGVGCGCTYYHDYPFAITGDAAVLKRKDNVPEEALPYVATIMDAYFSNKYSYEDKCSPEKIENETILLPASEDYQPDWQYMEDYMKKIMRESATSLENLRQADYSKRVIDVNGWGEFRVGDLFEMSLSKDDIQPKAITEGDTPLISSGKTNNGIIAYIQDDDATVYQENTITVDMFGKAFYQPVPYYCVSHGRVNILTPLIEMNVNIGMFLAIMIERVSSEKYTFDNMCTGAKLAKDIIYLPITPTGELDWQYMEDYMREIMDATKDKIHSMERCL